MDVYFRNYFSFLLNEKPKWKFILKKLFTESCILSVSCGFLKHTALCKFVICTSVPVDKRSTLTVHDMFVWSTGCQLNVWCMSNSDRIYTRVSEKLNQRCKLVIFVLISTPIITGITSFHPSIPIFYYKSQFPCLLGKVMIDT